jgi:Sodium/hydrogen exchanger family
MLPRLAPRLLHFRVASRQMWAGLLCGGVFLWPVASAAAGGAGGHSNALFVAQLIALLLVGRLLGEIMLRIGQPVVMGQLLAGILLGPSVLGAVFPHAQLALFPKSADQRSMIDAVGQLGVLMLLLLTGMETDLSVVFKIRRPAITVSFFGIAIPFLLGFALGQFIPTALLPDPNGRLITALFCGVALSISSVKIVAMVVRGRWSLRIAVSGKYCSLPQSWTTPSAGSYWQQSWVWLSAAKSMRGPSSKRCLPRWYFSHSAFRWGNGSFLS